ncbi:MAG: hypothetical protein Q4F34_07100, partial [Prevotellaceae bacterium]|nr:hypothetical protein [Prevotellaceae bacterium]
NLNTSRFYTVWAPVNCSFDAEELLKQNDEKVLKEFVQNHIAERNYTMSPDMDEKVVVLNKKSYTFDGKSFGAIALVTPNLGCKNGVIHTLQGKVPFLYNVSEYINEVKNCSLFVSHVKKYDISYLDEHASIKGPIIEGVQTWTDSVVVTYNSLFQDLRADVLEEDSSYTILIPNDTAWNKASRKISSAYNYLKTFDYQDLNSTAIGSTTASSNSMTPALGATKVTIDASYYRDSLVKKNITENLIYNNNESYNSFMKPEDGYIVGDTILTTLNRKLTNVGNILGASVGEKQKLSNGWAYTLDSLEFLPWETYNPTITSTNVGRMLAVKDGRTSTVHIMRSMLDPAMCQLDDPEEEELTFIKAEPSTLSGKPELDFYLNNVRSATYNIYVVMVPACVEDPEATQLPYSLRFDLSYTNEEGNLQRGIWSSDKWAPTLPTGTSLAPVVTSAEKVDTISLGQFTFPICYYGIAAAPNIKISHTVSSFTSSNRKKYEQILRVAKIILKPVDQEEYEALKEE